MNNKRIFIILVLKIYQLLYFELIKNVGTRQTIPKNGINCFL